MKQLVLSSLFLLYSFTVYSALPPQKNKAEDSLLYYKKLSRQKKNTYEDRLIANEKAIYWAKQVSDSVYLGQLDYRCDLYYYDDQYDQAITQSKKLLYEARRLKNKRFIGKAYFQTGDFFQKKKNSSDAFSNYVRAIESYSEINDSLQVIRISKKASYIQASLGDIDGAEYTIVNALDYSDALKDLSQISWFYDILGRVYRERGLWQEAIRYHRKALQIANNTSSKASLINNYAITLLKSGDNDGAIQQLEVGLAYKDSLSLKTLYRLKDNYGFAKSRAGHKDAIFLLEEALSLRSDINDIPGAYASHIHLAEAYMTLENTKKTAYHAQQAYNISSKAKNTEAVIKALDYLIPVTRESNVLFEEYTSLSDSLTKAQNNAKFEFAKLRYDVEKAEERESRALEQITASQLREDIARRKINWALAGIGTLVVIAVIFILYQRERSKKQRLLDRYETEKRIAKKLHDELANEIYLVMNEVENEAYSPAVADRLEDIYKLSRDLSRDTKPIQTDENFPTELAMNLQTYTSSERKLILRGLESIDWNVVKPEVKIEIYRVLQELMTNMRKHSKASLVALVFKTADKLLEINYSDNGKGVSLSKGNRGSGLLNTQNRIKSLGGHIQFESAVDEGFRAELSIPI